ncbi:MAG: M20/M25/M40 family metallo-hydrolase [Clostridiales bacterium]|nr:M20/M25/M40 family metallo-hydrolase [Clostridiales bacterium]
MSAPLIAVLSAAGLILLPLTVSLVRTLLMPSKTSGYVPAPDPAREKSCAEKLSRMVQCETVSVPGLDQREKFLAFHRELEQLFPRVHDKLEKTEIDGNLLFFWKGQSSEKPVVLMSHQDVVPAEGEWIHPPFSGDIADGKVWGRGASDTKCSVMAFLQAAEDLLAEGFTPPQDVYLSSSCTEEWGGDGCPKLVSHLKSLGVKPWMVVDEGGGIITDPIGGIHGNFAMIGVLEKGNGNVRFTARSDGGHASAPPKDTPIARLAAFVHDVETHRLFRRKMPEAVKGMFASLAPYASFPLKWIFGNLWLFRPVLLQVLPAISPAAGAMIRTTVAFTMASGSDACNVLPQEASVSANMRFMPHQAMDESLEIIRRRAAKHGVEMEVLRASDCCRPVDLEGEPFRFLCGAVENVFPGCPYSPYVMTGATDARFYQEICDHVFRFAPVIYGPEQMKGMHGLNENIGTACLPGAVDFYRYIITHVS